MRGKHPPCQSLEQTLLMPNPWATTRCAALIDGPHRPPHQPWALPCLGAGWATAVPAKTLSSDTFRTSSKSEGKHQWEVPQAPCPLVGQSWRTVCEDFKGLQWDWAPVGQSGDCSWAHACCLCSLTCLCSLLLGHASWDDLQTSYVLPNSHVSPCFNLLPSG